MKKVMLFVGGWSAEREVSLAKGKKVETALRNGGYEVIVYDVPQDLAAIAQAVKDENPDVVFNNLHGRWGEDGHMQSVLNLLQVPYTHSGVLASSVGMDKRLSKNIAQGLQVDCPHWLPVNNPDDVRAAFEQWKNIVLKPACEGSSVHTYVFQSGDNRVDTILNQIPFGETEFMVEEYIAGHELTVAVLDNKAQNVTEIIAASGFFDYESKYVDTHTRYEMPAQIPAAIFEAAMEGAEAIYKTLSCRGIARCDFRYDPETQRLAFLEINTQPGLTAESIGPSQLVGNGMSFEALCAHMVETARCD